MGFKIGRECNIIDDSDEKKKERASENVFLGTF